MHRPILAASAALALIGAIPTHALEPSSAWGTKPVVAFTRSSIRDTEIAPTTFAPRFGTKPVLWNRPQPIRVAVAEAQPVTPMSGDKAALWTVRGR